MSMWTETYRFNSKLTFEKKSDWDIQELVITENGPNISFTSKHWGGFSNQQEYIVEALYPSLCGLAAETKTNDGKGQLIYCNSYTNEFRSMLHIAMLPNISIESAMRKIDIGDILTLGHSAVDASDRMMHFGMDTILATGIIPMDKVQPYTALRVIQFFIQHERNTFVFRFNSYIPTPNDNVTYDDSIFFGASSKQAMCEFVLERTSFV